MENRTLKIPLDTKNIVGFNLPSLGNLRSTLHNRQPLTSDEVSQSEIIGSHGEVNEQDIESESNSGSQEYFSPIPSQPPPRLMMPLDFKQSSDFNEMDPSGVKFVKLKDMLLSGNSGNNQSSPVVKGNQLKNNYGKDYFCDLDFVRRSPPPLPPRLRKLSKVQFEVDQIQDRKTRNVCLQKSKLDPAIAMGISDWSCSRKRSSNNDVNHEQFPSPNPEEEQIHPQVNLQIFQNNPIIVNPEMEETPSETSTKFPITKTKLMKKDLASLLNYVPPSPSSFQNCEVDSGNIDALVSHVLQHSSFPPEPTESQNQENSSPDSDEKSRPRSAKSPNFNPGITIHFNYNNSSDAAWTWNHQRPPGSPSAYFSLKKNLPLISPEEGESERNECKIPSYLLELHSSMSEISLVPMIDSISTISSSRANTPENGGIHSPYELVNESSQRTTANSLEKNCPMTWRLIEILNQYNKLEDGFGVESVTKVCSSPRVTTPIEEEFWPRSTSVSSRNTNSMSPPSSPLRPIVKGLSARTALERGTSPKATLSKNSIKRNIVQENIFLAKYATVKSSTPPKKSLSSIRRKSSAMIPILNETQRVPQSPYLRVTGSRRSFKGQKQGQVFQIPRAQLYPGNIRHPSQHHFHQQSHIRTEAEAETRRMSRTRLISSSHHQGFQHSRPVSRNVSTPKMSGNSRINMASDTLPATRRSPSTSRPVIPITRTPKPSRNLFRAETSSTQATILPIPRNILRNNIGNRRSNVGGRVGNGPSGNVQPRGRERRRINGERANARQLTPVTTIHFSPRHRQQQQKSWDQY